MDAAISKGRLRQQILSGEQDIDALSGGGNSMTYNQYQQQYPQQNAYVPPGQFDDGGGSRKASLTSQLTVNRFFKRRGGHPAGAGFDDENGVDIGAITNNTSFDDITHLRGSGPYALSGVSKTLDTTPFIPTLGVPGLNKPQNNIQYRKQLNHQKKLTLANGARAMSLAGGNPMTQPQSQPVPMDPRAMSLGGPRTMSLQLQNGPRAMSLTNRGPMGPGPAPMPGPMHPGNPRAMSLRNQNPMYQGQMGQPQMGQPGMGQYPGQPMGQPMGPGPNGRAMSLGNRNNSLTNQYNGYRPMPNQPYAQQGPVYGQPGPAPGPNGYRQPYQPNYNHGLQQPPFQQPGFQPNQPNYPQQTQHSNDSLMNVVEEEEEQPPPPPTKDAAPRRIPPPTLDPASNDEDADTSLPLSSSSPLHDSKEDVVYKFDDETESPLVSRKSTIKKSNSMRLRKLDLFNASREPVPHHGSPLKNKPAVSRDSLAEESPFKADSKAKLQQLASANEPSDNDCDEPESDTLAKRLGSDLKLDNARLVSDDVDEVLPSPDIKDKHESDSDDEPSYDTSVRTRELDRTLQPTRMRSLVANTAFSLFRNASSSSHAAPTNDSKTSIYLSDDAQRNVVPDASDKSTFSRENNGTPPTANTSNDGSRNKNVLELINTTLPEDDEDELMSKKDRKRSSFSLTGKSKSFLRRLSKSSRRSSAAQPDYDDDDTLPRSTSFTSAPLQKRSTSTSTLAPAKPLKFTKDELAMMTCNNDLLNELQLVTAELAGSIKRELALESKLKNSSYEPSRTDDLEAQVLEKSRIISELQEKLANERRLRFISEEHALLLEHGQSPSALKLSYEKNEMYKQLLAKNELVNQLQDKLSEYQSEDNLVEKYNELVRENSELKFNKSSSNLERPATIRTVSSKQLLLGSEYSLEELPDSHAELSVLRTQRDELREMITKLTSSHQYELKQAHDKIRNLEDRLQHTNAINDKLSKRDKSEHAERSLGGLQGFTIVSPTKKFFD